MSTHHPSASTRHQRGQVSLEYLAASIFLCIALLASDPSPLERLLNLVQHAYDRFAYGITLP